MPVPFVILMASTTGPCPGSWFASKGTRHVSRLRGRRAGRRAVVE
ncbi:hypothetical protein [Methanopyrus kandleri]